MRGHLAAIFLLATTLALSVESKPHHEHHALFKSSPVVKDTGAIPEEADAERQFLPTLDSLDGGSGEPEDLELSANANANANSQEGWLLQAATQRGAKKTTAVLLSEEELADLLNKDTDGDLGEEQDVEEEEVDGQEAKADRDPENSEEKEGKMMEKHLKMLEGEEVKEHEENVAMPEEQTESVIQTGSAVEEADGSSDSEILADLDYASDADHGIHLRLTDVNSDLHAGEELKGANLTPTISEEEQGIQIVDAGEREEMADQAQDLAEQSEEQEERKEAQEPKLAEDLLLETPTQSSGEVGEERPPVQEQENQAEGGDNKTKDAESVSSKGKKRKGLRQRARKHTLQGRDQAGRGPQPTPQPGAPEQTTSQAGAPDQRTPQLGAPDQTTPQPGAPDQPDDSTAPVAKRRRAGKWTPLVGMNPVQIRATVDLYLSNKPSVGGASQKENSSDPCSGFRCKRGKTCKLSADLKPACVCQEPSECPASLNDFDHVCGTDNKTYDTACELFATKCNLEGTKRGHKLHLDYTGPCKLLPPCLDSELVQFPLRMRDWLKNVLLQLYEHDSISPGFLTAKQRAKVRKIHENEKRLHAGDHPLDLLAQDFEKNYNLYIYPVHWQFAQMDKHPSDRLLSHSELAPLRVPLVPMEHCTSRFFQECDGDRDKQLSFPEWAHCFGIQDADMDVKLLF